MARKCKCPPEPAQVPAWFMTYSDVITLLMTFFILLLTFATNEPEHFERMQTAIFGGGGATGMAGKNPNAIDQDALVVRYRPKSARKTQRGSEMPPSDTDPVNEALSRGLESLQTLHELATAERFSITLPLNLIRDDDGRPTDFGLQQLRMLGVQLRSLPLEVEFQSGVPSDIEFSVALSRFLLETQKIPPGRVSVSQIDPNSLPRGSIRLLISREISE